MKLIKILIPIFIVIIAAEVSLNLKVHTIPKINANIKGFRTLLIGDSIMDGANIEAIDGAFAGYNSWDELRLLKENLRPLNPDFIIIGICMNDYCGYRTELRKTWLGEREVVVHHSKARRFNYLYQRSILFRWVYNRLYYLKHYLSNEKVIDGKDVKPDFEIWKQTLQKIIALTKDYDTLFVIFPLQLDIGKEHSYPPLTQLFKEQGVNFIDMIDYLEDDCYVEIDYVHLNDKGYSILNNLLTEEIEKRK